MSKVPAAAEEAGEEVEWIVASSAAALVLALLQAFVAVLVVDFARFGVGEGFVGFGDFDEFLFGGFIAAVVCVSCDIWAG